MKNKYIAGLLAFFLGFLGVHRFYLGQVGLGILYIFMPGVNMLISFIDFISFMVMDEEVFDVKYNRDYLDVDRREYNRRNNYRSRGRFEREHLPPRPVRRKTTYREEAPPPPRRRPSSAPTRQPKMTNPYKKSGIQKYKDYDYDGAIEDFKKSLAIEKNDKVTHFNIACAYSLNEQKGEAFYHLTKAVENGMTDYNRIQTHDALAYLRIQDEWDAFVKGGYSLVDKKESPPPAARGNLLEQLRQLGELREKGLLTSEEFEIQKKRLLDS